MTTWADDRVAAIADGWLRTFYTLRWHQLMSKSDQEKYMRQWVQGRRLEDDHNIAAPKSRGLA